MVEPQQDQLARNPVAAVIGPRQCGKSTLVKHLREEMGPSIYLDHERPSDLAKISDPDAAYVVAPIDEAYPLNDRITIIPLSGLKDILDDAAH